MQARLLAHLRDDGPLSKAQLADLLQVSRTTVGADVARLGELAEGDTVVVVDDTGAARSFTVLAREEWSKSEVPLDRIFDRGGSGRLVLITCGGDFDADSGHYEDNIAITAVPVAASSG